jgi:hypothetical protein
MSPWMLLLLPSSVMTAVAVTNRKAQGSSAPDNVSSRLMINVSFWLLSLLYNCLDLDQSETASVTVLTRQIITKLTHTCGRLEHRFLTVFTSRKDTIIEKLSLVFLRTGVVLRKPSTMPILIYAIQMSTRRKDIPPEISKTASCNLGPVHTFSWSIEETVHL